jgi:hypothetical protein
MPDEAGGGRILPFQCAVHGAVLQDLALLFIPALL